MDDWVCWQRSTRTLFLLGVYSFSADRSKTDTRISCTEPYGGILLKPCLFPGRWTAELSLQRLLKSWPFWISITCNKDLNQNLKEAELLLLDLKSSVCYEMRVYSVWVKGWNLTACYIKTVNDNHQPAEGSHSLNLTWGTKAGSHLHFLGLSNQSCSWILLNYVRLL